MGEYTENITENITRGTGYNVGMVGAVVATPSFLATEELLQLFACGKVGTVACVLSPWQGVKP